MMSVTATVFSADKKKSAEVLIFIDTGCSETYVSSKLVKQLDLTPVTSEELKIVRMGERVPNKVVSNGYDLYVKSVDRELMPIYAIELEHIINPIESIEVPKDQSALYQGIELQDLSMIRRSPDILLGIEHMAMLELTVHHQLAIGLNLFSSRLGPIV